LQRLLSLHTLAVVVVAVESGHYCCCCGGGAVGAGHFPAPIKNPKRNPTQHQSFT